jgi:formamidopyrimidine-DNA glycosylase
MPELPEVETIRRGLDRWVTGRRVRDVEVHHPRAVRRHVAGPDDFAAALAGRTLAGALRRGKYLWLPLDGGDALVAHLGMSGQLLVGDPVAPRQRHLRARLTFCDGGHDLRFVDQRTFGGLSVAAGGAEGPPALRHIARDPVDPLFDEEVLRDLRRRRTGVKRALLDQRLISGIGNIYADEALWRARLHWGRPTDRLTAAQARELLTAVRAVLAAAIAAGGTSFDALYVNVNGQSGYFARSLEAYGRAGLPCRRCGTPIRRDHWMNRSAYSCPACQPRPRVPL